MVITEPSKVKDIVTSPSDVSGVNVISEQTSLPSTRNALPVLLSIKIPFIIYFLPGIRCLYETTSSMVISPLTVNSFLPSIVAVVPSSGILSFSTVISIISLFSEIVTV